MNINSNTRSRRVELIRAGWALLLVTSPQWTMGAFQVRIDTTSLVVARILGARHLTQAVLSGIRPSPEVLAMGVWVDTVHAVTSLGLAGADRDRLRPGLLDAAIATVWAGAGYRDLATAGATGRDHQQLRNRLARIVLGVAPGGQRLLARANRDRRSNRLP